MPKNFVFVERKYFFFIDVIFIADKKFANTHQLDMNVERFLKTCMFILHEQPVHFLDPFFKFQN